MNCAHVLDLIDAGDLASYPSAHLDVAWQHARGCATCGPALARVEALTARLQAMPSPPEPIDFAAAVIARIARIDEMPQTTPAAPVRTQMRAPGWVVTTAGGVLAVAAIGVAGMPGAMIDVASGGLGRISVGTLAGAQPAAVVALILGLLMYARGLFTALGAER